MVDVTSNFTFLTGASKPEELVQRAAELGYRALGVAECRLRFEFDTATPELLVFASDRASYGRLCRLLTVGKRRAPKGECHLAVDGRPRSGGPAVRLRAGLLARVEVQGRYPRPRAPPLPGRRHFRVFDATKPRAWKLDHRDMDRSIDAELLQRQSPWLRRLALELVGDHQQSEDVLQETWLAALENPAGTPGDEPGLRKWLARVLRNRVLLARRGSGRRAERERRHARSALVPSVAETVERANLQRELMEAVMGLKASQRDVVLLRYLDGLPPREIARRLRVSDDTVRSRLSRGLSALRSRLDRERAGERAAWTSAFLAHLLPHGESASLGALLVKTQTKIVLFALVAVSSLAAVGTFALRDEPTSATPPGPTLAVVGEVAARESKAAARPPLEAQAAASRRAVVAALPPAQVPAAELSGRVADTGGEPVADVLVRFEVRDASWTFVSAGADWTATTDSQGLFRMPLPGRAGRLVVDAPEWITLLDERLDGEPPTRELELYLAPRRDYAGTVVDEDGAPVAGASLFVSLDRGLLPRLRPGVKRESTPQWSATSLEFGAFELGPIGWVPELTARISKAGFEVLEPELPKTSDSELRLVLRRPPMPAGELTGVVVDAGGKGVAMAYVFHGDSKAQSDADGHFVLPRDEAHDEVLAVRLGYLPAREGLAPGEIGPIVLTLGGEPLTIQGRVVDASGSPVQWANVWTSDGTPLPGRQPFQFSDVEDFTGGGGNAVESNRHRNTGADGRFELTGLLPRTYSVHAMHPSTQEVVSAEVEAGTAVTFELAGREATRRVAGHVLSLAGDPIAGARLLHARDAVGGVAGFDTPWVIRGDIPTADETGYFEIEAFCTQGAYFFILGEGLKSVRYDLDESLNLEQLEIRLPLECRFQLILEQDPGEADSVTLLDAQGAKVRYTIELGETGNGVTSSMSGGVLRLKDGGSDVVVVDELTRTLVLWKDGQEIRRVPVRLTPGGVQVLRL